ncbi:uncharacterized protein IWZ02DRAFT_493884 [Phyllosticta citriasiana]|uniref:Uncharacterized protein n=1 Tax=Phyllosticta citriasiana TaxID=595635 RepID=A0ABR1L4F0_9PEZI
MRQFIHDREAQIGEELFEFAEPTFELHEEYIGVALATRKGKWHRAPDALAIPDPLNLRSLPQAISFNDERQYLSYTLGARAYEYEEEQKRVANFSNGTHTCAETWTGAVIKVPRLYLKEGCNVAVAAERPPFKGGRVLEPDTYQADFFFGHHGQSPSPIRNRVINFMTSPADSQMWFFKLLLAHDNYNKDLIKSTIKPKVLSKINERCAARGLNKEQKQAVLQYFGQNISIVVGPGGTGKSTLVDTIVEIEGSLKIRLNEANPHRFFRVRKMFDERLSDDKTVGQLTATVQGYSVDEDIQEIL